MKHRDEAIDRVLAGLRDVEPSPGFEARVLAAMQARAAVRVGWRPQRLVLACALVAIAVAGARILRPARKPTNTVARVNVPVVQPRRVEVGQRRNTEILRVAQNDLEPRVIRMAVPKPEVTRGFPAPVSYTHLTLPTIYSV